ncbi:ribosomal protein S12pasp88 methylthiotransferase [Candidatus Symbiothrix dinenymphae]|nr:ribosomal protein S12pasp88 methylthiotransferase [Candidatus Symbiothrix dinenymphae]
MGKNTDDIQAVDIISLGCSKNLVDSEQLMRLFAANGYSVAHEPEKCRGNIVVINTCGFIDAAKEESINTILPFAEGRKSGLVKQLFVMGCLSERYMADLQKTIPEVDKFYGKFNWKELLTDLEHSNSLPKMPSAPYDRILTTPSHYAYLKISEGCDRTCAFCSIPLITGKQQSRTIESLEAEVKQLVTQGVKEFQLIAQDLTAYGTDLYRRQAIAKLVDRLSNIEGVEWLRLHYAYPNHFPMELLKVMRDKTNVCNYLDIALQHSCDTVLQRMKRHITQQETLDLIGKIRAEVPDIHLRTTLMVGFPDETPAEFEALLRFVDTMRFERMGAFMYSAEEGTSAAKEYPDSISPETKQQRLDKLMTLQAEIAEKISMAKIGKTLKVIIDREENGYYIGRTEYDSPEVDPEVLIEKTIKLHPGTFYNVKITGTQSYDLIGTI